MEHQSLRYKFELAIGGMKDGPVAHSRAPPYLRLQLLLSYRNEWPKLMWNNEHKMNISVPALLGYSGGFIHQIHSHGVFTTLELTEVPSSRTNKAPFQTRHLKYTTSAIEVVAVDFNQALVVMGHVFLYVGF